LIIKKLIKKNNETKDSFQGRDCYIFGNGLSLKYFDLKNFSDKPSITCGWTFLHKDFNYLNVIADFEIHPGIFWPFWKNQYSQNYEYNIPNYISKKKKRFQKSKLFFTSVVNLPGLLSYKNIHYIYHFGKKNFNSNFIDPSKEFSLMENSLYSMIGVAHFMGFKNVYLVGMDYLLDDPLTGHFYENYKLKTGVNKETLLKNKLFFDFFSKTMNFKIIKSNQTSNSFLNTVNYNDFFNEKEKNYKNYDIIELDDLKLLDKAKMDYKIF